MADYTDLQTELVDLLKDTQVDTVFAQTLIARAEPKIDRDLLDESNGGQVPRQKMTRLVDVVASDGTYDLPADYHETRAVLVSGLPMRYASPEKVPFDASGTPQGGFADAAIQLDYYQRLPMLSATNLTNWLLDISFDLYLYGSAIQFVPWSKEPETLPLWLEFYRDAMRTTKRTHSAQPRGGNRRQNGRYYKSLYTIIGEKMYFGSAR